MIILADGTIVPADDPRARGVVRRNNPMWYERLPWWVYGVALAVSLGLAFRTFGPDDLSNGHVPASDRSDHWAKLSVSDFVRAYTRNANQDQLGWLTRVRTVDETADGTGQADYGGRDGHAPEEVDFDKSPTKAIEVTRCSSTNYAVTAYFCGDAVASNKDRHVDINTYRETIVGDQGVDLLERFMGGLRDDRSGGHGDGGGRQARTVFRFGFGPTHDTVDGEPVGHLDIEHVWTVVALPTGEFWWLQSFIGHYSLLDWMSKPPLEGHEEEEEEEAETGLENSSSGRPRSRAIMGWKELRRRFDLLRVLEAPRDLWDGEADDAYAELFDVRPSKTTIQGGHTIQSKVGKDPGRWKGGSVSWDLACAWPQKGGNATTGADFIRQMMVFDVGGGEEEEARPEVQEEVEDDDDEELTTEL